MSYAFCSHLREMQDTLAAGPGIQSSRLQGAMSQLEHSDAGLLSQRYNIITYIIPHVQCKKEKAVKKTGQFHAISITLVKIIKYTSNY